MKKIVLIFSIICSIASSAQVVPKQSFVFNFGYNFPAIKNDLTNSDFWDKKPGTGIEFSVDYRKQFRTRAREGDDVVLVPTSFALGIGLGISQIKQTAKFENFSETVKDFTDIDGNKCNVELDYQNVSETVSLTYLDIPLYLEIGKPSREKISTYLKLGLKASLLISDNLTDNTGIYTSKGYYPEWKVTLHDIPELDYFSGKACYGESENYDLSPFVLWGTVSAGVNFPFGSRDHLASWIIRLGAKMDYSLTPVSKNFRDPSFPETKYYFNQSNLLGGNGSKILSFGLSLGLIYCY